MFNPDRSSKKYETKGQGIESPSTTSRVLEKGKKMILSTYNKAKGYGKVLALAALVTVPKMSFGQEGQNIENTRANEMATHIIHDIEAKNPAPVGNLFESTITDGDLESSEMEIADGDTLRITADFFQAYSISASVMKNTEISQAVAHTVEGFAAHTALRGYEADEHKVDTADVWEVLDIKSSGETPEEAMEMALMDVSLLDSEVFGVSEERVSNSEQVDSVESSSTVGSISVDRSNITIKDAKVEVYKDDALGVYVAHITGSNLVQ